MDFTTGNTDMHLLVTDTLKKGRSENQSVSGVTIIFGLCSATHNPHRVDQAVDCGQLT
jgi:hypothetical protein